MKKTGGDQEVAEIKAETKEDSIESIDLYAIYYLKLFWRELKIKSGKIKYLHHFLSARFFEFSCFGWPSVIPFSFHLVQKLRIQIARKAESPLGHQ